MKAGWQLKKLGEVCDLQNGYAFKSTDYIEFSNTLNIRMSSIRPDGSFDSEHNQRFLPDNYANEYKSFLLSDDDLIIAMTDMAGDPKILGVPTLVCNKNGRNFLMNQRVGKLFGFSEQIHVPYLRYFLTSPQTKELYKNKGAGGLQINISKADVLSVDVPFPNIDEQQRIVTILDQAFEGIAKARANAEQNLQNARALFESHLQSVFTQRGDGYEAKIFDEVLEIKNGKDQKPVEKAGGKYPIYGSAGNVMGWTDSYICDEQTTIIGRKGTINRPIFIETKFWNVDTAFGLAAKSNLNAKFLYFFCLSYDFSLHNRGTTIPSLVKTDLLNIKISVPSLSVQELLVKKFTVLHNETKRLEANYQRKITLLDELKKSLLQQAFSGKL